MRRILRRLFQIFALLLILLTCIASGTGYWFVTRSFPETNGTIKLGAAGASILRNRVEVIRDPAGVPNIYADNSADLLFAQGYIHAQDRLWQMDLNRRLGNGQLSEIFGDTPFGDSTTLEIDKFTRTIGLGRAARADFDVLDSETKRFLRAYADGVNSFLHSHADNLPIEFNLLGYRPADWQPVDTLVWAKVIAFDGSGNFEDELMRSAMVDALGEPRVRQLIPSYPPSGPFIIPSQAKSYASQLSSLPPTIPDMQSAVNAIGHPDLAAIENINAALRDGVEGLGSSAWVVDGSRTASGKPALANDSHLAIGRPSAWYMNGLHCAPVSPACPFDVTGFTFPGLPGVVVGHNRNIAWGVTSVGPDVQDLYVEKQNPANPEEYWAKNQWQSVMANREVIRVKGGADVALTIQYTDHGPVITPVLKGVTAPLALEWTAINQGSGFLKSLFALDAARSWGEFRNALRDWDVPAQNFVYADVDGNIGYQLAGMIPVRSQGDGSLPSPGWSGDSDWGGYIPFDELPSVLNPPTHLIVSANNQVVPDGYKYQIASDYAAPFRSQRIEDLLGAETKLSVDDLKRIQGDIYSIPLVKLKKQVEQVTPLGFLASRALPYVKKWDGNLTPETIGGTILEVTYMALVRDVLTPWLGTELFNSYLKRGDTYHVLFDQMLENPNNPLWNDPSAGGQATSGQRVAKAYMEGVDWLGSQFGDWPPDWHWGRLHTATFAHPLKSLGPLGLIFGFGPISVPGDSYTVLNKGFDPKSYVDRNVSSMRDIIDLSNLDSSLWIQTTGQSGQPLNPHHFDLTPMWRDMKYQPLYYTREAVERVKSGDLYLEP